MVSGVAERPLGGLRHHTGLLGIYGRPKGHAITVRGRHVVLDDVRTGEIPLGPRATAGISSPQHRASAGFPPYPDPLSPQMAFLPEAGYPGRPGHLARTGLGILRTGNPPG